MLKSSIIFLLLNLLSTSNSLPKDPHIGIPHKIIKTSADRIRGHGYAAESHFVETVDGYVLNLFRIPYSPKLDNKDVRKPVVFIQHGLFSSSDCFLLNGPDNALAYNFADAGFDVWMGNARGNTYSRNNTKISMNHPNFWRFSWHEIGFYDLPAMIDYILSITDEKTLHYAGHSQGVTAFFVMTSTRPEYNDKIKTAHLLAPPIFMSNSMGLVKALAPYFGVPESRYTKLLGQQQFVPHSPLIQRITDAACGKSSKFPKYCETLFLMGVGNDPNNMNVTLIPEIAETHPAGISSNQAIHFVQLHISNLFRNFDNGLKENMKIYGQETPPEYPLDEITAPLYIYYGLSDGLANANDVKRLPEYLTNIKLFHEISEPSWGHLDFVFSLKVKEFINDPIIKICLKYEEKE